MPILFRTFAVEIVPNNNLTISIMKKIFDSIKVEFSKIECSMISDICVELLGSTLYSDDSLDSSSIDSLNNLLRNDEYRKILRELCELV